MHTILDLIDKLVKAVIGVPLKTLIENCSQVIYLNVIKFSSYSSTVVLMKIDIIENHVYLHGIIRNSFIKS